MALYCMSRGVMVVLNDVEREVFEIARVGVQGVSVRKVGAIKVTSSLTSCDLIGLPHFTLSDLIRGSDC